MQIRAMQREVRIAVNSARGRAEIEQTPGLPRVPQPHTLAGRLAGKPFERVADADLIKHARRIRGQLHARADLLERLRLFENGDIEAPLEQCAAGGEAADPGTCNDYLHSSNQPLFVLGAFYRFDLSINR